MLIAPSPTADATRLTFPDRTSPTANTPGRLVSNISGARSRGHHGLPSGAGGPVQVPARQNEPLRIQGQAAFQPLGSRRTPVIRNRWRMACSDSTLLTGEIVARGAAGGPGCSRHTGTILHPERGPDRRTLLAGSTTAGGLHDCFFATPTRAPMSWEGVEGGGARIEGRKGKAEGGSQAAWAEGETRPLYLSASSHRGTGQE
jgi:hypothetical protein